MAVAAAGRGWLDRIAMALSGLCLVHCLTTAIVVSVLATAGGALLDPRIHEAGLALAVLLAAIALGQGVRVHRAPLPAALGCGGLAIMALALAVPHGLPEVLCTMIGVSIVAVAHALNRRALG